MQPIQFKVPIISGESIRVEHWDFDHFYDPLHFHEECQLTYVIEGRGTAFIGSAVHNFQAGDVFLIGKNLPHVLRNSEEYFHYPKLHARAITVFFKMDSFLPLFERIPEAGHIDELLKRSVYGINIIPEMTDQVHQDLMQLSKLVGFGRISFLLQMLDKISESQGIRLMSPQTNPICAVNSDLSLINKVFEYVNKNSNKKIPLAEISSQANMTSSAFCRYFKLRTKKTFSSFLTEIRIATACRLIMNGICNSSEACYASGYNNVSNFNRHFKKITGMTPSDYKKSVERINYESTVLI